MLKKIKTPLLSIIIPFKNTDLKWLEKLFRSLKKQTNQHFEVICIDDSSENNIDYKTYIESLNFKYFLNKDNILGNGVGKLRDFGVDVSKGDFIWFIDSDDWIVEDAVEYLLGIFLKNNEIDLIAFQYKWVYKKSDAKLKKNKNDYFILDNLPNKKMTKWFHSKFQTDWRICFKKEFLTKNKILHKNFLLIYEDVYFGLIWKTLFKKAAFSNKVLYFYNRMNTNSILSTKKNFNPNILLLNIMSSKENLIKENKFDDKWYFYANNWSFIAACCKPYKKRKENKVLIKNLIGEKQYRNFKVLGFSKTWWASNIVIKNLFLVSVLKKILKIKVWSY